MKTSGSDQQNLIEDKSNINVLLKTSYETDTAIEKFMTAISQAVWGFTVECISERVNTN